MDADPPEIRGRPEWRGEATDRCTRFGPSGYWAWHVGRVNRVIGGDPRRLEVAPPNIVATMVGAGVGQGRSTDEAG